MRKLIYALLLLTCAVLVADRAGAQVVIVANNSVKGSDVAKGDLRDVFTGASTSLKEGGNVVPVLQKAGAAHDEFLQSVVGKNDTAFRAGWRSLVFSGQATMPKNVDGDAAVVEFVSHTPGGIGYISKASAHEGVKVLALK